MLEIDPDYVPALTLQALIAYGVHDQDVPWAEIDESTSDRLIRRALTIDPDDGIANAYMGWNDVAIRADLAQGVELTNKALAAESQNAEVLRVAGATALMLGLFDEGISLGELAIDRNPLCGWCDGTMVFTAYLARDYERVEYYVERRFQKIGRSVGWLSYASMLIAARREQDALDYIDEMDPGRASIEFNAKRAVAMCRLGKDAQLANVEAVAESVLETSEPMFPLGVMTDIAAAYACLDDADRAFMWLDRTLTVEDPHRWRVRALADVVWSPLLEPLHDDPRWLAFRASAGLGEAQLAGLKIELPTRP